MNNANKEESILIKIEQLEKLESRIVKAIEMISDLRLENNQLESQVGSLKTDNEKLKLTANEKIQEVQVVKDQLIETNSELNELKLREKKLETKILEILDKLETVRDKEFEESEEHLAVGPSTPEDISSDTTTESEEVSLSEDEKVATEISVKEDLDKEEPPAPASSELILEGEKTFESDNDTQESSDIVIDGKESELILDEDEDEGQNQSSFSTPSDSSESEKSSEEDYKDNPEKISSDDSLEDEDILGVFDEDDDEDFLIVEDESEEEEKKKDN